LSNTKQFNWRQSKTSGDCFFIKDNSVVVVVVVYYYSQLRLDTKTQQW
jgi:hypothetical protein